MSSTGELGPDADILQEWIVDQFRMKCKRAPSRADGIPAKELVQDFRHKLKLNLQFAMAIGMGNMITQAGLPHSAI